MARLIYLSATQTVLEQAELLARDWAESCSG